MLRLILLSFLSVVATGLWASESTFEFEVTGTVDLSGGKVPASVELQVRPDRLYGHTLYRLPDFQKKLEEFPEFSVDYGVSVDKDGTYSVTGKAMAQAPFPVFRQNGVDKPYAALLVTVTAEGCNLSEDVFGVHPGEKIKRNIRLVRGTAISGRLIDEQGRAMSDVTVEARKPSSIQNTFVPDDTVYGVVETDSEGRFTFENAKCPSTATAQLVVATQGLCFSRESMGWKVYGGPPGKTRNLGDLVVVKSSNLTAQIGSAGVTGVVKYSLLSRNSDGRWDAIFTSTAALGRVDISVPPGRYQLLVRAHDRWDVKPEFDLPAEGLDLGGIELPHRLYMTLNVTNKDGETLKNYGVKIRYLGENWPDDWQFDRFRNGHATLVVDKDARFWDHPIPPLFAGRFRLEVVIFGKDRDRYLTVPIDFELPIEGTLNVVLEPGGTIDFKIESPSGGRIRTSQCWAIRNDSEYYKTYAEGDKVPEKYEYTFREVLPGVWSSTNDMIPRFTPLPEGTYMVLARAYYGGDVRLFRIDAIEVKAGKTIEVVKELSKSCIEIVVTRGGVPAAGEKLTVYEMENRALKGEVRGETITDQDGKLLLDPLPWGTYVVMTQREVEIVADGRQRQYHYERVRELLGETWNLAIELEEPGFAWLTLEVKAEGAHHVEGFRSVSYDNRPKMNFTALWIEANKPVLVGKVPLGRYRMGVTIGLTPNTVWRYEKTLDVNEPGDQTKVVEFLFGDVRGRVTFPPGVAPGSATAEIRHFDSSNGQLAERHMVRLEVDERGGFSFEGLLHGDYRVRIDARAKGQEFVYVATKTFTIGTTPVDVSVPLSGELGHLEVAIETRPNLPRVPNPNFVCRIELIDSEGKEIVPEDPLESEFDYVRTTVHSLVPGTYTLKLSMPGLDDVVQKDVRIVAGKATSLKFKPDATAVAYVKVKGPDSLRDGLSGTTFDFLDDDGNVVVTSNESSSGHFLYNSDEGLLCSLAFSSIPQNVKSIRLKIPGAKEIQIEVDSSSGATKEYEVEASKE